MSYRPRMVRTWTSFTCVTDHYENIYYAIRSGMFIVHCVCADDGDESFNDHEDGNGSKDNFREQDIYLPIANVARIMKNAIPQTGKVVAHPVFCVLCILHCSHVIEKPIKYQGILTRE